MKKRWLFIAGSFGLLALSGFGLYSCSKDDNNNNDAYLESARDESTADYLFSDVFNQVDLATRQLENELFGPGNPKSFSDGGCATTYITPFDTITWPKTVTIDFGETNCEGADGKYRRGVISALITGRYRDSLTVVTITPDNYFVNDYKVEGLKTVTNLGHITGGLMTFGIDIQDGLITKPDGRQFLYESQRTRVWIEGESTAWPAVMDDVFELSGFADGTTYDSVDFHVEITVPLRIERDCRWIISGALEITPEGLATRGLDYGTGDCDNKATLTVKGNTYEITLP
jgi:hypothetical protein